MQGAIFSRPTWQGLFLQSCCISSIHGGQMWGVQKMQGAIFSPSIHGHYRTAFLAPCGIPSIHGHKKAPIKSAFLFAQYC